MKVSDFCTYAPKSPIKAGEAVADGEYMFFTSSSEENKRYSDYQLDCEGIIMGTGGNATLHYYNGKFATSTDCVVLLPNETIRCKYLYYFFLCNIAVLEAGFKGAGLKHTNKNYINSIELPNVPPLEEQDKVIEVFDKVHAVVSGRMTELSKLDELVKARFVEMFGSINDNKFGFEIKTLQDVCEQIKDGTHQTPTYTDDEENGYKFLSSKDVTMEKIDWSKIKYIPADLHEELYSRIAPKRGDILLAKNGTTGIAAVVDTDDIFDIYVSLALLRPISINSTYLWAAINSPETKRQFDGSLKGIGVPNLHLGEIKKTLIIVPPIELQNEFEQFVKQLDKSKFVVQQALDKAKTLFDSLMQKYFG